jgi:catechol 2,3-dioxygenase-like lactoylglutathione lyase family enzyme
MVQVRGVYEVAIRVRDLARSEQFYRSLLGLRLGLRDEEHHMVFLRVGGQTAMIVLQEDRGDWSKQHFAFTVDEHALDGAAELLRERGIEVRGPVAHEGKPARSLYFDDPDGHSLELCAAVNGQAPPT